LRDLLLRVAHAGLVRARCTDAILDEFFRSLAAARPELGESALLRTRSLMNDAVATTRPYRARREYRRSASGLRVVHGWHGWRRWRDESTIVGRQTRCERLSGRRFGRNLPAIRRILVKTSTQVFAKRPLSRVRCVGMLASRPPGKSRWMRP
jgi:hypothetical protein